RRGMAACSTSEVMEAQCCATVSASVNTRGSSTGIADTTLLIRVSRAVVSTVLVRWINQPNNCWWPKRTLTRTPGCAAVSRFLGSGSRSGDPDVAPAILGEFLLPVCPAIHRVQVVTWHAMREGRRAHLFRARHQPTAARS